MLLQIFKSKFKGCEVAEVTRVAQGFCGGFSLVSPKLRGYGSYGAFENFQNKLKGYEVAEVSRVVQSFC